MSVSLRGWGSHVTITDDSLDHTTQDPQTRSNLFSSTWTLLLHGSTPLGPSPTPNPVQGREHEARTVGKRVIGILLECFLVFTAVFEQLYRETENTLGVCAT